MSVYGLGLMLVSLTVTCHAQAPDYPNGGGTCYTDADCSLGGVCVDPVDDGSCLCDPWWTGEFCDLVNVQPPEDSSAGTCGEHFEV